MTKQNLIKRFFARFMRARAASAAPAFLFAAAAAGFALAPLDASAARISGTVETGDFGDASDQSLAVGNGNITIGGDASVDVTETTLLSGTQLTISSTSDTLDFGNVTFQQPVTGDSITVSGEKVSVSFDKVAAGAGYGKIDVADGAALVINGDANLSAITAEDSALTVKGTATVETLTAKTGADVTLEAADASGVNSLVMAGGTVNVKKFTLDNVDGTNEENNNASGTISSSGTLTVNTGTTLTTEALNLEAKEDAAIDLKNGSEINLGTGTVSLGANAQLNIGDAYGAADLTAASLTADETATTTLNGGTLELNGAGIKQYLDSLAETSTGTVSVSGEGATAVFSADKTFEGLDIAVENENGTLQVDAVVSTTGTVTAENLTVGGAGTSVKASAFELSPEGTLTMNGGTLDLSATNGAPTNIYAIAEGSSGTITEGDTAGTIALNTSSTGLDELDFTAESGTVALTETEEGPITVETEGNVNARNLVVGANMLVGDNVTVGKATDRTGDGLTLNGGTLRGTTNVTVNKVVEDDLSGTVDGGTVIFDLDQKENGTVVAGTLNLGSEATSTGKVWIRGEGLTLDEGSVVTATGDGVNENNGTATGLVVGGGAAGTATVFDLSAEGTKLNVNAVNVYSADELKLSGDQKIGIGDNDGKILLGVAATNEVAGKISTTGTLTSLGQTTMNGGRIESIASSPAPAPEQPEEGVFYPEATIHLGNVEMGNGVISAVNGSVKVAAVSDQGIIAAKDISVGSVSDADTDTNKVILAGSENGATAADKLTFTGTTTASNISANKDSVVNTKALELADGVNVTIGSETNKNILNEENLASVALGGGASLNTTSEDLSALTSVALATGTADDRTTWTHSSGITVNGDVSVGNDASIDADGAVSVVGSVSVGNRSDITAESINFGDADLKIGGTATLTSETGDVTLGGVLGLEDGVLATATVNSAKDIVFAADSTSSLHLKATGDIVVNENVSVTLSQGEIDAKNTTLKDGSTFELLGNNNVLGGTTGTPEENPYDLSEVTLGNDATLVIGGNNPAEETEFYETFAKADSVKNASADAVGTIEVNGKLAEDKVSVFTAETVGDEANGGVNVTLNGGGALVATGADAAGVGIYAAALNGTGGKLTAQAEDGTKNDIYVTASNTVGKNIAFTADELRVTDLDVNDGADVAVRLENADLGGVDSLVVADAESSADTHTKLTLAGTSSVAAVTVGKDGNNGTLFVESLPAEEGEEAAAPVVVIDDLAEDETANFQTGSLTLDGGALVANGGSIDVRNALAAGTNGLDGTLEAKVVRVDLSAQTETFGDALTLKGETVTLDGNASDFALGAVVDAGKLVIGSDAEGETTAVSVADPVTTLDGVANEIAVENGDSLFVTSDWTPTQDRLTVTLDTDATLAVFDLSDPVTLTVGADKSFAVNAAVDGEENVAEPNVAVFDEIVNNGNFSLGNVVASADSWTDAEGATLTITGTKTDTEERLASLDISGAADGTTTFNSAVALTNGALAVAQGNVVLNGAVVSENGTVDVEAGDLTANDTVSLTDSEVTASGDVALNGAVSSENGAITATTGSLTVSGGAGTIESLALTAGADITFDTNEFDAEGAVTVVAVQGTGNVTFGTNVSLGAGSSVAADTLTVNAGAAGTINGTVDVETIVLSGATSDPDPVKDAASLTISGEGNSTFTTLTDAAGTTLSLTNGAALTQNVGATAPVSLNGTLSVADANSAFSTPGSLTLADTAKLTLANGGAANIAGTLDLSASTTGAVTVAGDAAGTNSDATTTLTAGTLVINPADAANDATQGVVSLTNGGQFTVGELAAGSTVTLTGQNGSGNIWVDETSHFTLEKGDLAITESTRGEIIAESGNVTFGHDADGNGVYELAGIGTHGLDLFFNSGHNEVNFTMSESLNADGTKTYSEVDVRGMMNLQGTDVSATGAEDQAFAVSVASGVNLDNAKLTLENVAFSGGKSVSLTGSSELSATNTTIDGFDAIITTVGANNSSITLNNATLNTDVTMNSGTLNVGGEGATIGAGYTVSVNENVSAKLEGNLTGDGKLALNGGNVSLTGDKFTLDNVVVNAANAKISGGKTLTIGNLEIGTGDALSVDAALSASGTWNVNGGSLTAGTLTIADGANVALENGSTFNGDITFANGADAELSLTNSTVDGNVTLDGENNTLKVTDSSITGTLEATAGSIIFNGTNSFGDLRLVSNVNIGGVLDVVGKLEVEGGFELEKDSELSTTEGLFVNGGTATLAGTVKQGDVTLTGTGENSTLSGTIETNLTLDNAQISSSGKVVGSTTLANGSTLTQTAGTLGAVSVDASTFTQNAGAAGAVTLTNGASATLAGTVDSLYATNATANVSGKVSGDMTLTNATAEVSGTVEGSTTLATGSALTQTAGLLGAVSVDDSTFTQEAGTAGAVTLTNGSTLTQTEDGSLGAVTLTNGTSATLAGTVASLDATNATANVSGTIKNNLTLDAAQISSSGTVVGSTTLANGSTLTQTAGKLGAVSVDASNFTQQNAGTAGAVTLTNGASFTQQEAGTVDSLYATNATANVSGTIKNNLTLDAAQISSSGTVEGSTTLTNDSTLTQKGGLLGAVSVDASTFTQEATGTAGKVTLTNDAFATLAGTVASLDATNGSELTQTDGTLGAVFVDASNFTQEAAGTVSGDMTLTNATAEVSGTVVGSTTLTNGSKLTQTDGTLGAVSVDASTFTQNAGTAGAVTLTNGASATLAGMVDSLDATNATANVSGTVSGAVSLDASTLTAVDGITISDTLTAENNSIVNGDIMLDGAADVSLSGSTVNGDIAFAESANGADLKLIESTVAGNVTLSGESNSLRVENSSITGALTATAGTITFDGENSFGDLQLSGDVNVAGDITVNGALNAEGGFNLAGSSSLSTTEGLFVNGGTANLAGEVVAGDVTLTGTDEGSTLSGAIETNLTLTNATAEVSGTVVGNTTLTNGSTLTQKGGTLHAVFVDASTFTQEAAGTAGAVKLTNGAFATLAGTVDSLDATNAKANVSGTVSGDMTLTNATAEVSGDVVGSTTLANGSTLTQTAGMLHAVSVDASTFTQEAAGTAGAVTLTNGASATLAGTVASLYATNATANVSGTVEGAVSLDASTLKAQGDKAFASLSLKNDSTLVSTDDITVTGAITDASGSISGANIALNGGLTGSASVTASEGLTLGGTTETSGKLTAGTLTVADGGTLTATDAQVEAGTLAVNEGATLNLTIEEGLGDDTKLSIAGTANLTAANALTLSNLSGAGTANKTGAGELTLSGNGAFTGALNIGAGNASLSGAFGGSIGFASEGGTITGARGASVAGTLTLAQGTTLEIGDASGAANLTVGKIALADATTRAAGTAKVVHDVFADGTNTLMTDTLTVTDATANLSGLTAVVRSNVDEEILGVGGQTITLVEGDVAAGYGFIEGIGFDRTNAVLSEDGKSLQVMLNWKAAADGLAGSLFNDNQRAVAAATKGWNASTNKYAQALSTLSTTETAAALDDLGALHTVAMMPGQIDGTWNHQKSVLNAIGTGSQMGYQFGKPDVNMGAWVQYVGSYNDVDSSSDRLGWDRTMNGATAGFEYALSENFLAGVALGYEYAELKSDGNKIEDDAFSVDFFAKHRSGDFEQRAALTFAHHGYDTNRTIAFGGVAESVSGDTDGFTAAIAYEAAYNFAVKEYLTLAPVATLRAALNTIDGWSESGSDAALKFDDQSAFTALAGIGGRAEFAFANPSYPREALRLSAYALFTAEFGDRSSDVDASFVRGGNAFTMTYDDPEPYALQLGLTAFAPLTNRTALFGGISTELRDEESGFNANIGVRIGW